jgi:cytoskeletal protein CcmA (bactofilin family)
MITEQPHQVPTRHSGPSGGSTIGEDLTIIGNVTSKGELHIDGRIQGDVRCASVVLGENSEIEGNVTAEDVVIGGRLIGSARALRVMLQSTAHVEGDLLHKDLAMEQGAFFQGNSRCPQDPLSGEQAVQKDRAGVPDAPERAEKRKDKTSTTFVRSLPEPDTINPKSFA